MLPRAKKRGIGGIVQDEGRAHQTDPVKREKAGITATLGIGGKTASEKDNKSGGWKRTACHCLERHRGSGETELQGGRKGPGMNFH